jgi:hypothetical protein
MPDSEDAKPIFELLDAIDSPTFPSPSGMWTSRF